ncbi:MAG: hypothetical protein O7D30_06840 [Rickettsia endosymbiont of Ixodes persulcatus]|nr:hypothetical protein [Rickettsia endosymbiont of Ixodes persulcatus]
MAVYVLCEKVDAGILFINSAAITRVKMVFYLFVYLIYTADLNEALQVWDTDLKDANNNYRFT